MKKNFLTSVAFALALGLVACDDSTSANGSSGDENPAEESSSSVILSSSSSVIPGTDPGSSSSVASSSSSSSSSSVIQSSSSEETSVKDGSKYDASANTLTDLRDGQVYKTVTIGTQIWMAENLNYAYKGVKYSYSSYTSDSTSWCYGNKASNCEKYGRLYTWSAVMDSAAQFSVNAGTRCGYGKTCTPNSPHRGICPEGWHVPTNEEYSTLYTYIGGSSTAGSLLKSTSGWNDYNGMSGNGSDKYGFSVLPAGYRYNGGNYNGGNFYGEGSYAYMWSASEFNNGYACYQTFNYSYNGVGQDGDKERGFSVRCLKD
ncbi:MAG: fibrobacter succinogenes major paralogous domain-containing protein [Fibrobacter sp.]|nr:fibrobacter succinogenes major paralogous domain-containing protein [Fibrobacter sp.]